MLRALTSWPQCGDVRAWLIDYAHIVPQTSGEQSTRGRTHERALLDRAFTHFLAYQPTSAPEIRFYDNALSLFRQLNESREHRYTIAALRLPGALRWFVFLGGAITVGSMWLTWLEAEAIQALLTAGMTWVAVAAYTIVTDLDDPYHGDFVVNWQRFHEVAERMRTMPCPSELEAVAERAD
jgi:hypothetical protein